MLLQLRQIKWEGVLEEWRKGEEQGEGGGRNRQERVEEDKGGEEEEEQEEGSEQVRTVNGGACQERR